jgi:hypothetical protein
MVEPVVAPMMVPEVAVPICRLPESVSVARVGAVDPITADVVAPVGP